MEYKIVTSYDKKSLIKRINELMNDGWVKKGDISTKVTKINIPVFSQKMIKNLTI